MESGKHWNSHWISFLKKSINPPIGWNVILSFHQAVRLISQNLPECEEDMLKIEGVTKANFDKYGKELLMISQQYAGQKLGK